MPSSLLLFGCYCACWLLFGCCRCCRNLLELVVDSVVVVDVVADVAVILVGADISVL